MQKDEEPGAEPTAATRSQSRDRVQPGLKIFWISSTKWSGLSHSTLKLPGTSDTTSSLTLSASAT